MIIVTGGSGKVGRACVKDLMEHGYKVASIDLARPAGMSIPPKPTDVVFSRIDITDFGQVMGAFVRRSITSGRGEVPPGFGDSVKSPRRAKRRTMSSSR